MAAKKQEKYQASILGDQAVRVKADGTSKAVSDKVKYEVLAMIAEYHKRKAEYKLAEAKYRQAQEDLLKKLKNMKYQPNEKFICDGLTAKYIIYTSKYLDKTKIAKIAGDSMSKCYTDKYIEKLYVN